MGIGGRNVHAIGPDIKRKRALAVFGDRGRDMGMCLARRRYGMKLAVLGQAPGGLDSAAVTVAVKRLGPRLAVDRPLAAFARRAGAEMLNAKMRPQVLADRRG